MTVGQLIEELKKFSPDLLLFNSNQYPPIPNSNTAESGIVLNYSAWKDDKKEESQKVQGYFVLLSVSGVEQES